MPAHDGGATYTGGRRTKTSKGGNRDGGAWAGRGRYGDLSGGGSDALRASRAIDCDG